MSESNGHSSLQIPTRARDMAFRIERRYAKHFIDTEFRQLRALQRAYRTTDGPELLIFGDSAMFWTARHDADRRHLAEIIRDEIDPDLRLEALVGASYGATIIMAFLSALQRCAGRPKVVIVPTSIVVATAGWLSHPQWSYTKAAEGLRAAVESGARTTRLEQPTDAEWESYDRVPAPSLIKARRTYGELRLITNAVPSTRWQHTIRLRHLMDYHNAERLTPDSPGIRLVAEMAGMLADIGLPAVAYISPINYQLAEKLLGPGATAHISANAELVADAFLNAADGRGSVVNAVFECPGTEFSDPLHVTESGRKRLGASIGAAVRPYLKDDQFHVVPA